ncbi:hypothetical protein ACFWZ2_38810 [Streptomyces sp. NPDC059002]|uniref:hypothetical protein n=1 Tax=Streptomyces sp. NPDC059002 TaxID=3346690 RepID=UPI0036C057D3
MPAGEIAVMVITVVCVVATGNRRVNVLGTLHDSGPPRNWTPPLTERSHGGPR